MSCGPINARQRSRDCVCPCTAQAWSLDVILTHKLLMLLTEHEGTPLDPSLCVGRVLFFCASPPISCTCLLCCKMKSLILARIREQNESNEYFFFLFLNLLTFLLTIGRTPSCSLAHCVSQHLPFSLTYFIETDKTYGFTVSLYRHTTDFTLWVVEGGTIPNQH